MRIVNVWEQNPGEILAYCVGSDITSNLSCKKVSVGGKDFSVLKIGSSGSLCGEMSAIMLLDVSDPLDVPTGEVTIL